MDTRSTLGSGVWVIGIGALLLLALVVAAFVFGWAALPFQLGSTGNVQQQFDFGYTQYNSMKATARMVCDATKAVASAGDANEKSQRQTQLIAVENNYNRLAAEYDKWASNIFQGKVVRPNDLPLRAPSLAEMKAQSCSQ